jgi:hypothetical protein
MTARDSATVTVKMLQGMAGERLTLEPGDLYQTTRAQAKLWAEHGVAELVRPGAAQRRKNVARA